MRRPSPGSEKIWHHGLAARCSHPEPLSVDDCRLVSPGRARISGPTRTIGSAGSCCARAGDPERWPVGPARHPIRRRPAQADVPVRARRPSRRDRPSGARLCAARRRHFRAVGRPPASTRLQQLPDRNRHIPAALIGSYVYSSRTHLWRREQSSGEDGEESFDHRVYLLRYLELQEVTGSDRLAEGHRGARREQRGGVICWYR